MGKKPSSKVSDRLTPQEDEIVELCKSISQMGSSHTILNNKWLNAGSLIASHGSITKRNVISHMIEDKRYRDINDTVLLLEDEIKKMFNDLNSKVDTLNINAATQTADEFSQELAVINSDYQNLLYRKTLVINALGGMRHTSTDIFLDVFKNCDATLKESAKDAVTIMQERQQAMATKSEDEIISLCKQISLDADKSTGLHGWRNTASTLFSYGGITKRKVMEKDFNAIIAADNKSEKTSDDKKVLDSELGTNILRLVDLLEAKFNSMLEELTNDVTNSTIDKLPKQDMNPVEIEEKIQEKIQKYIADLTKQMGGRNHTAADALNCAIKIFNNRQIKAENAMEMSPPSPKNNKM